MQTYDVLVFYYVLVRLPHVITMFTGKALCIALYRFVEVYDMLLRNSLVLIRLNRHLRLE